MCPLLCACSILGRISPSLLTWILQPLRQSSLPLTGSPPQACEKANRSLGLSCPGQDRVLTQASPPPASLPHCVDPPSFPAPCPPSRSRPAPTSIFSLRGKLNPHLGLEDTHGPLCTWWPLPISRPALLPLPPTLLPSNSTFSGGLCVHADVGGQSGLEPLPRPESS